MTAGEVGVKNILTERKQGENSGICQFIHTPWQDILYSHEFLI